MQTSKGFRDSWQYNNYMYVLAGEVVRKVSGKSWEDFISSRIFSPLGMNDSNFSIKDMQKSDDYAHPYNFDIPSKVTHDLNFSILYSFLDFPMKEISFFDVNYAAPAGCINSNIEDMSKWIRFQMKDGKIRDKQLVSKRMMDEMHHPQMVIRGMTNLVGEESLDILPYTYGLAWFIHPYRGHYFVEHGGKIDGFSAIVSFMPDEKIGVIALSNKDSSCLPTIVSYYIYDKMLGVEPDKWSEKLLAKQNKQIEEMKVQLTQAKQYQKKGTRPSHPLKDYTGKYYNPIYGQYEIKLNNNKLSTNINGDELPIVHWHYDVFLLKGAFNAQALTFNSNILGDIDMFQITLEPGIKPIEFTKIKSSTKQPLKKT
jgi:hypothetical protein